MKVLHFGASGGTAVRFLKLHSVHHHELISNCGDGLNQSNVSADFIAAMVDEADVLQFHEPVEYPHKVDWPVYGASKKKIFYSNRSLLSPDGTWRAPKDSSKVEGFDCYWGTHLGMTDVYAGLKFAPEFVPVNDWLLQPGQEEKPAVFFSRGGMARQKGLRQRGIEMEVGYLSPESTMALRYHYSGVLDNYWTGFWSAFGVSAMAQGLPVVVHVHERNRTCLELLKAKQLPPFIECDYSGGNLAEVFTRLLKMPAEERLGISRFGVWWARECYDPERITWLWDGLYDDLQ